MALAWAEGDSLKARLGLACQRGGVGLTPPAGWPNWAALPLWALLAWLQVVNPLIKISGDELYYRGYLLPKMSVAFGRAAWPINALLFVFKQSPQTWLAFRLENLAPAFAATYYGQCCQLWAALLLR